MLHDTLVFTGISSPQDSRFHVACISRQNPVSGSQRHIVPNFLRCVDPEGFGVLLKYTLRGNISSILRNAVLFPTSLPNAGPLSRWNTSFPWNSPRESHPSGLETFEKSSPRFLRRVHDSFVLQALLFRARIQFCDLYCVLCTRRCVVARTLMFFTLMFGCLFILSAVL